MDIKTILSNAIAEAESQVEQYRDAALRAEGGVQALRYVLSEIEKQETDKPIEDE